MTKPSPNILNHLKQDLPAGLVVFLVALPLCLGIALASGAPLFSGVIAGVIGGIVVGWISGSHTSVSGPAAGLTVIVWNAIEDLGSFELFLSTVVLAGMIQIILGILRAGIIGYYFPTSVIKGMLSGIGVILIIKQLPYALGINEAESLVDLLPFVDDAGSIRDIAQLQHKFAWGAVIISALSLLVLKLWESKKIKDHEILKAVPGPLVVVIIGIGLNFLFEVFTPSLHLTEENKVKLPEITDWDQITGLFLYPDFSMALNPQVWLIAFTIAIVASLETLLSLEAADKIDPLKRVSPPNRELFAQGIGNIFNGLVGGLPVTAVIVRSSANVSAGSKTKMAAISHGFLLLVCVIAVPHFLNLIPISSLAAILLSVGYKLTRVSLIKEQAKLGKTQFLPFLITLVGIILFDLLTGIALGMSIAIFNIILRNYKNPHMMEKRKDSNGETIHICLSEEVSFLNKGALIKALEEIPNEAHVIIDGSRSKIVDYDIVEVIENFRITAKDRNIKLETKAIPEIRIKSMH